MTMMSIMNYWIGFFEHFSNSNTNIHFKLFYF